ncbi:MAG: CHAD domain-containing protein, partial [Candidatus Eisenbacteria bacterium]|nr:CHAD domain-containing protein [Candidatus Eisenbacteria bacterium]
MTPCYVMPPAKDKRADVALRAWIEECGFTPAVTYRLSTKDTYHDTYDGRLSIAGFRLYFRHGENRWYLEKDGKTKFSQSGSISGPKKGGLKKKLHAFARKSEWIPLLHVLREEQVFESKADPENQIKTIHFRYQDPFVDQEPLQGPRLFVFHESGDIEHLLLSQLEGERKDTFDPLLEGLALLNIVAPHRGRFSFEAVPSDPISLTLKKYLALQADVLTAHRRGGLLDLHVEFVHQLRVATRRGRAVARTLAPHIKDRRYRALARELKWLGNALGHVRDFDVLLPVIRRDLDKVNGPQAAKDFLMAAFEKRRAASLAEAQSSLGSERFDRLIQALKEPDRLSSGKSSSGRKGKERALLANKPTQELI